MKTLFILIILFLLLNLSIPSAFAACDQSRYSSMTGAFDGPCITQGKIDCKNVSGSPNPNLCCDTNIECNPALAPSTTQQQNFNCSQTGIITSFGCVNFEGGANDFMGKLITFAIGIAGGIAFLLMLFATFQIMTSAGNPDKLKGGKELLTSAIAGLLLIIFSVYLLQFIGITVLDLPFFVKK